MEAHMISVLYECSQIVLAPQAMVDDTDKYTMINTDKYTDSTVQKSVQALPGTAQHTQIVHKQ